MRSTDVEYFLLATAAALGIITSFPKGVFYLTDDRVKPLGKTTEEAS